MKKGIVISAACLSTILLVLRSEYEKHKLRKSEYCIKSRKLRSSHKFVFLTDLHEKTFGRQNSRLLKEIDEISPEAVLIGGDMIMSRKHGGKDEIDVTCRLIEDLTEKYPVYYAFGNHERRLSEKEENRAVYERFLQTLRKCDVHILCDEMELYEEDIRFNGINLTMDFYKKYPLKGKYRMPDNYIKDKIGTAEPGFNILMMHHPLYHAEAAQWGADLVLSGHFHGGTIRLPFVGGIMTPQYQFFLPECSGRFQDGESTMIVGRGLGTHSINIRLNNFPELVVLNLKPEDADGTADV